MILLCDAQQDEYTKTLKWDELSDGMKQDAVCNAIVDCGMIIETLWYIDNLDEYSRRVKECSSKHRFDYSGLQFPFKFTSIGAMPLSIPKDLREREFSAEIPAHMEYFSDISESVSICVYISFSSETGDIIVRYLGSVGRELHDSYDELVNEIYEYCEKLVNEHPDRINPDITVDDVLDAVDEALGKISRQVRVFINKTLPYLEDIRRIQNDMTVDYPLHDYVEELLSGQDFDYVIRSTADGKEFIKSIKSYENGVDIGLTSYLMKMWTGGKT